MIFFDIPGATPLDPNETAGLKLKHITTKNELDHLEQSNIQEGIKWLNKTKEKEFLTERFLKLLHKNLFGEIWSWAGKYRETGKNIGVDAYLIGSELRQLFDDTKYWIENQTYDPIEIAVRFHHRLVKIHPFPNGNGRHARIMADIILTKELNHPPIDWSKGHDLQNLNDRRSKYILALKEADNHNYQPLLNFVH